MTSTPPRRILHLVIHGQVQGVRFRDSMRREAQALGIAGWVRNGRDGTVEAVVQGEHDAVDAILRWARRGPELARVERIEVEPAENACADFRIIR